MDGRYLWGSLVFIPMVMAITKMYRMDARDRHEVHMDVRYKAVFWEKGNSFIGALNEKVLASVAAELDLRQQQQQESSSVGSKPSRW